MYSVDTYRVTEVTVRPTILHEKWYFSKNHFVTRNPFYLLKSVGESARSSTRRVFWSRSEFKIKKNLRLNFEIVLPYRCF